MPLSPDQIQQFIQSGFVRVDDAFSGALADAGRAILWRGTGCDPADPSTWTKPVIRLGMYHDAPFREAASSQPLREAFDGLVGPGRWVQPVALGTFPIRFPSGEEPGDDGWHVDVSFGTDAPDFMDWRANVFSTGRALLMLFLFSDVGPDDAPTRLRIGSHVPMARMLAPAGDAGMTLREMVAAGFGGTDGYPEALAIGPAGTVYLCHPFLVHAAQKHRGKVPRFMAQPPLLPAQPLSLERAAGCYSPVEQAIRLALKLTLS